MFVDRATSKYNQEYKKKLEIEMIKFNGKSNFGDGTEKDTASEMTTATKLIGKSEKSAAKGPATQGSRSSSPDKDAFRDGDGYQDGGFDPDPVATQGDQMELEE